MCMYCHQVLSPFCFHVAHITPIAGISQMLEAKESELESFLRQVGWTAPGRELPEGDWYQLALQFVQYIESQKPGLIERMSKVSVPSVLAALQAA